MQPDWGVLFAPDVRDRWEGVIYFGAGPATVAKWVQGGAPVYLATPYSKRVTRKGKWAHDLSLYASAQAAREMSRLARVGITAVSPIVQAAEMVHSEAAEGVDGRPRLDPLDAQFWERWCRPLLDTCSAIVVPDIEGWQASEGIHHEVMTVLKHSNRRVFFYAGDF